MTATIESNVCIALDKLDAFAIRRLHDMHILRIVESRLRIPTGRNDWQNTSLTKAVAGLCVDSKLVLRDEGDMFYSLSDRGHDLLKKMRREQQSMITNNDGYTLPDFFSEHGELTLKELLMLVEFFILRGDFDDADPLFFSDGRNEIGKKLMNWYFPLFKHQLRTDGVVPMYRHSSLFERLLHYAHFGIEESYIQQGALKMEREGTIINAIPTGDGRILFKLKGPEVCTYCKSTLAYEDPDTFVLILNEKTHTCKVRLVQHVGSDVWTVAEWIQNPTPGDLR